MDAHPQPAAPPVSSLSRNTKGKKPDERCSPVDSTAGGDVGSVIAGRTYDADCALVPGQSYTACGATTSLWAYVNYSGDKWGYVPSACLTWAS